MMLQWFQEGSNLLSACESDGWSGCSLRIPSIAAKMRRAAVADASAGASGIGYSPSRSVIGDGRAMWSDPFSRDRDRAPVLYKSLARVHPPADSLLGHFQAAQGLFPFQTVPYVTPREGLAEAFDVRCCFLVSHEYESIHN